ncbi:MAG: hypothetical protein WD470_10045 [Rhodospirillaceae bacterium]
MSPMYEIVLCYRRRRNVGRRALKAHWRGDRKALVRRLQHDLGFSGYTQLHRSSRLNALYLGIRATRSWPSAALFSLLRGRKVPSPFPSRGGADERWDIVETLAYPSLDALRSALATPAGASALAALRDDAAPMVRNGAALIAERRAVTSDDGLRFPRTVTMFQLRARPPMTGDDMLVYWGDKHRRLVESQTAAMGHRTYDQLHALRHENEDAQLLTPFGGGQPDPFAGIARLAYGSQWDLVWRLADPRLHVANMRLVGDEVGFIDLGASILVFGTEEEL